LSYIDARAWKDIYGHRTGGSSLQASKAAAADTESGHGHGRGHASEENHKAETLYRSAVDAVPRNIIDAGREQHALLRRAVAHGFSEKALRSQEARIQHYVKFLVEKLERKYVENGDQKQDMMGWYNWTVFDVVGELVFAEPFGCLEKEEYHPFVNLIMNSIRAGECVIGPELRGSDCYRGRVREPQCREVPRGDKGWH
jgi:hypothetical protein